MHLRAIPLSFPQIFDTEKIDTTKKDDIPVKTANIEDILETWEVASSTESIANSAETFWSEGSTNVSSDEFEDEDLWNDWSDEHSTFEELKEHDYMYDEEQDSSDDDRSENGSEVISRIESETSGVSDPSEMDGLDIPSLGLRLKAVRVSDDEEPKSTSSIPSHYSQSLYSTTSSGHLHHTVPLNHGSEAGFGLRSKIHESSFVGLELRTLHYRCILY